VGSWGSPWAAVVDKQKQTAHKIWCPFTDETQCSDLEPLPDFDIRSFPFVLHRNRKSLNLINLRTGKMNRLLMRENNSTTFEKMALMKDVENSCLSIVFITKSAVIEEIKVPNLFFTLLRDLNMQLP
jgi:hypothetical protein